MSFNEQVARAIVRGYNIECDNKKVTSMIGAMTNTGWHHPAKLEPPADSHDNPDAFNDWFEWVNQPEEGYDPRNAPCVIMGITSWVESRQQQGQWDPHRAFYLLMRGIGFSVTEDKTDAIIGALYECWQGYTWMSYDANKLDMCFPPPKPAEPAPERLCGAIPISGNMKGQLSCTVPASEPHTDHRHGLWTWQ